MGVQAFMNTPRQPPKGRGFAISRSILVDIPSIVGIIQRFPPQREPLRIIGSSMYEEGTCRFLGGQMIIWDFRQNAKSIGESQIDFYFLLQYQASKLIYQLPHMCLFCCWTKFETVGWTTPWPLCRYTVIINFRARIGALPPCCFLKHLSRPVRPGQLYSARLQQMQKIRARRWPRRNVKES